MKLARRAQIMKALAHPCRLLILEELLCHEERCVCELTKLTGTDISTVSRHLAVLRIAGIVADDKRGQQVFYRLRTPEVAQLVRAVQEMSSAVSRAHAAQLIQAC